MSAHHIYPIDSHYIKKGLAAFYILRQGDSCAIIDTGTSHSLPYAQKQLTAIGLDFSAVQYVIPTHVHLDHAGGASALMKACPNAQLVIHPYGSRHMIDPSRLIEGTKAVYGSKKFDELYGSIEPIDAERVIEADDGFSLTINGRRLLFLDTPGHANHHFCIYDEISESVFTGDTLGLCYPQLATNGKPFVFATTTPVQFKPDKLYSSIDKVCALGAKQFFLTHFGCVAYSEHLIAQLKHTIAIFCQLAIDVDNSGVDNKQVALEQRLSQFLLAELEKSGCRLSHEAQKETIQGDVVLNAQGLLVWRQKTKAA